VTFVTIARDDAYFYKASRSVSMRRTTFFLAVVGLVLQTSVVGPLAWAASAGGTAVTASTGAPERISTKQKPALDRSGKKRIGRASFYAQMFAGRKMANGNAMDPKRNNAASRTLPLGTTAKVTNLNTGKSAVVTIQDRGPYVNGRIVDLSPATAQAIGITPRQGLAKVQVSPITVPLPNGGMMYGAALEEARLASNERAHQFPPVGW
jgi:rare lipoprotein A